jgi:hypothetical protein
MKFILQQSVYDEGVLVYTLDENPVIKDIEGIPFIETTRDFKTVQMIRLDSLKPVGEIFKRF